MSKPFVYHTNCVNWPNGDAIQAMQDEAIEVTLDTVMRACSGVTEWAKEMGYAPTKRSGLTLRDDWAVSYWRSRFYKKRCYFIKHSAIEHIWIEGRKSPDK